MKIGSLFSGYGGLTMGIQAVLGGDLAWNCDYDAGPSKVLAHHDPDVPNLGDITTVDWSAVEPVDVIEGGSPCQDVSAAGKRAGMRAGTRSGLWASMCDAIDTIRPSFVVWENVRGVTSACADSELGQCPGCLGHGQHRPVLRALGRVLGDLADLGYDARWQGVRAADVGAPHPRFRVFVTAQPADTIGLGRWPSWGYGGLRPARLEPVAPTHPHDLGVDGPGLHGPGERRWPEFAHRGLAAANPHDVGRQAQGASRLQQELAPAAIGGDPAADSYGGGLRPDVGDFWGGQPDIDGRGAVAAHATGNGWDEGWTEPEGLVRRLDAALGGDTAWGIYAPAIARWECITGREAPAPTEVGARGGRRLGAPFVEWLMGLPAGHVTAVPGVNRNEQLKLLGNGVVPQQAALALRLMGFGDRKEASA